MSAVAARPAARAAHGVMCAPTTCACMRGTRRTRFAPRLRSAAAETPRARQRALPLRCGASTRLHRVKAEAAVSALRALFVHLRRAARQKQQTTRVAVRRAVARSRAPSVASVDTRWPFGSMGSMPNRCRKTCAAARRQQPQRCAAAASQPPPAAHLRRARVGHSAVRQLCAVAVSAAAARTGAGRASHRRSCARRRTCRTRRRAWPTRRPSACHNARRTARRCFQRRAQPSQPACERAQSGCRRRWRRDLAAAAAPALPARESGAGGLLSSTAPPVRVHSVRRGGGCRRRPGQNSGFTGGPA